LKELQFGFENRIFCDPIRVQLQVDPFLNRHFPDLLDIPGTRAKGHPVQDMNHLFIG